MYYLFNSPPRRRRWHIKAYLSRTFRALESRDYRLFAAGQAISVSGVWMQRFAQAWLVLELTDSSLMLGLTVALQQIPLLLFTVSGGALADRFDRRRILIVSNACGMLPALAIGATVALDLVQLWMVWAAAVVQGLVDALEKPARMSLVNDIVGPKLLTNAVILNNSIQNTGKLIGPAVAGIVIGAAGMSVAFFVNAATFVPVVVGLWMIRPKYIDERTTKWQGGIRHTLGYVAKRRPLAVALGLTAVVGVFGYNFQILVPVMFKGEFGDDAAAAGFGLACLGLGGVLGGLAAAGKLRATARGLVLSAAGFGLGLALLGLAPVLGVAYGASFVVGVLSVIFAATSGAHIQLSVDREMRGRMMGLYVLALGGTSPFGGALMGAIAEWTSGRIAFLVAAGTMLVACAGAYRIQGKGRRTCDTEVSEAVV